MPLLTGSSSALRVCWHPHRKDEPIYPSENNHGNQDKPPPRRTEAGGIFPSSGQRKRCRVLQTNSWWQQITEGTMWSHFPLSSWKSVSRPRGGYYCSLCPRGLNEQVQGYTSVSWSLILPSTERAACSSLSGKCWCSGKPSTFVREFQAWFQWFIEVVFLWA